MMRVRLQINTKTDFIITYAPPAKSGQKDTPSDAKDDYYSEFSKMLAETPKYNKVVVMADMNVKIRNPKNQREKTVIGNHGLVGRKRTEDMDPETEASSIDSRERMLESCLEMI